MSRFVVWPYVIRFSLAVLVSGSAWAQAPLYTTTSIVNASDFTPAPFAPNSVLAIFGSNLSWDTASLSNYTVAPSVLPTKLAGVQVFVDNYPAPLLYVSPAQINFVVPGTEIAGDIKLRVVRESVTGPEVVLALVDAAPALFDSGDNFIIAEHADCSVITGDSPAHASDIVVIYATGLGRTQPNPNPGEIPQTAATIVSASNLVVSLDGTALPAYRVKYAGLTPFCAGLYQINLELPDSTGNDPEIRIAVGAQSSPVGLKILVR